MLCNKGKLLNIAITQNASISTAITTYSTIELETEAAPYLSSKSNNIMAPKTLDTLPKELLTLLIDFIPRPTDLKSLCLTNRVLREAATPRLYKDVELDESTPGYPFSPDIGFFSPKNPGHAYLRSLTINYDSGGDASSAQSMIKMALSLLHRDQLQELCAWRVPLDETIFIMLITQQRRMKRIDLGPMTFDPTPWLNHIFKEWLISVENLDVPVKLGSIKDLLFYQHIIQRSQKLNSLSIRTDSSLDNPPEELKDSQTTVGLLSRMLFSHCDGDGVQKVALKHLTLEDVTLTWAEKSFIKYIDFSLLRTLQLFRCSGVHKLLALLTAKSRVKPLQLAEFRAVIDDINPKTLEDFIGSFKGLTSLCIRTARSLPSFDYRCLSDHSSTLQILFMSFGDVVGRGLTGALVSNEYGSFISRNCNAIEQVGIALPLITFSQANEGNWSDYGKTITCLLSKQILVLRIFTLPEVPQNFFLTNDEDSLQRKNLDSYLNLLDQFATDLFRFAERTMVCKKLPIIYFGCEGWIGIFDGNSSLYMEPVCYVAAEQRDVYGTIRTVAVRTSIVQAMYVEPKNYLLGIY